MKDQVWNVCVAKRILVSNVRAHVQNVVISFVGMAGTGLTRTGERSTSRLFRTKSFGTRCVRGTGIEYPSTLLGTWWSLRKSEISKCKT